MGDEISFWDGLLLGAMSPKNIHRQFFVTRLGYLSDPFLLVTSAWGIKLGHGLNHLTFHHIPKITP